MAIITKKRRDGWVILYNNRVLCGLYETKKEATQDAQGLKRTVSQDSQLKTDLDRWASMEE